MTFYTFSLDNYVNIMKQDCKVNLYHYISFGNIKDRRMSIEIVPETLQEIFYLPVYSRKLTLLWAF